MEQESRERIISNLNNIINDYNLTKQQKVVKLMAADFGTFDDESNRDAIAYWITEMFAADVIPLIDRLIPISKTDAQGSELKREKLKYHCGYKSKYQPPSNYKFYGNSNEEIINAITNI